MDFFFKLPTCSKHFQLNFLKNHLKFFFRFKKNGSAQAFLIVNNHKARVIFQFFKTWRYGCLKLRL